MATINQPKCTTAYATALDRATSETGNVMRHLLAVQELLSCLEAKIHDELGDSVTSKWADFACAIDGIDTVIIAARDALERADEALCPRQSNAAAVTQ